jgi:AbrB family looped-hinge helix DNA binding protein
MTEVKPEAGGVFSPAWPAEWLDRFPWLAIAILVAAPFCGHLATWVMGLSANPIWRYSEAGTGVGPGLIAGALYGDPNVGWTNQALGHLAAMDWLHGKIPWWNPYSGVGLPLAGEMQPAALFMPFVLLLALPGGILWLIIAMQIFAGIAMFCLLRRLGLGRLAALVGGLLFAFCSTFTNAPGETILNVVPFLPLLLHGIEDARDAVHRRRAVVLIGIGIGGSLLGGFPETAYTDGLLAFAWALVRFAESPERRRFAVRVGLGGVAGLLIAAPQIIAFIDFSAVSDLYLSHQFGGNMIRLRGAAVMALPFGLGPIGTQFIGPSLKHSGFSVCGYIGALPGLFVIAGLRSHRHRPIVWLMALWIVISMAKTFGFTPVMTLTNAIPFMRFVSFWRYGSPSWELAAIVLAGFAFEDLREGRMGFRLPLVATLVIVVISVGLAWPFDAVWHWDAVQRAFMAAWLTVSVAIALVAVLLAGLVWVCLRGETRRVMLAAILVVNAMVWFMIPQLSGARAGQIDWPAIDFLKTHMGDKRFYSLGPIAPNYSAYFGIANINHNYLPVALNWVGFVQHNLFASIAGHGNIFLDQFPPMSMTEAANDISRFLPHFRNVGVGYVVAPTGVPITPTVIDPPPQSGGVPLALYAGQAVIQNGFVPHEIGQIPVIDQLGIDLGNYNDTSDGILSVVLCAGGVCRSGEGDLARSVNNMPFGIGLDGAILLHPGEAYTLTVRHVLGTHPVAIWLYPGSARLSRMGGAPIAGRVMQLAFGHVLDPAIFSRIYRDPLMTIWHLAGAAPFYAAAGGGCAVQASQFDRAEVVCKGDGLLERRELFMAGWRARNNGIGTPVGVTSDIFQSVSLHRGINRVRFWFAPPYSELGWGMFWLGVLILLWQGGGSWSKLRLRVASKRIIIIAAALKRGGHFIWPAPPTPNVGHSLRSRPVRKLNLLHDTSRCILPASYIRRRLVGIQERVTTVISTKGQVILPKAIRDLRHWAAGTQLIVENTPDGVLLKSTPIFPETDLNAVFGALRHTGPALSIEEMNAAISSEARRSARD